jgi:CDP-glycerol glycerophosphotransferase
VPGRPLVSVVIPVRDLAGYLPGCLDSVLCQDPAPTAGFEVIAVDDASVDGSAAMLDERAAADSRLRVVHLADSAGPGRARNVGLSRASGSYVWFVDGDDLLAPGALAAVAEALAAGGRETARPDVLLIDWVSRHEPGRGPGRTEPAPGRDLLAAVPPGGCTLADQPRLIELTMTSWSRLLRREFLAGLGVPFGPGIHEDVPVTCAALLRAGSIAALPRVCYHYRRQRRGSFMATPGDAHLAIFGAYGQVFDRMAADPPGPDVQAAVFERAIWHYAAVLAGGRSGLVPPQRRQEFFARMHEEFTARRPPGYRLPPGARGLKFRLIQRGAYRSYAALEPLNRLRVAVRRTPPAR